MRSANDVAVVVAEALGNTESGFARMMTQRANELGMTSTVFRNASGLPDNAQVTTARDMATLSIRVMQDFPQYYHYFSTQSFTYRGTTHTSHNRLLRNYAGADGLKTGFIRASGFNVATSAIRNDRRIVSVVMGGFTAASRDTHMADLLDRGFARLSMLQRGDWIAQADVLGDRMDLPESPSASAQQLAAAPEAVEPASSGERQFSFQSEMGVEMGSADDPIRALIAQADTPRTTYQADMPRASSGGNWAVQVGAFNDPDQARHLATRAADQLSDFMRDVRVSVAESEGERRVFRARLVDLQESDAHSACNSLRAQGMDCMVVAHYWRLPPRSLHLRSHISVPTSPRSCGAMSLGTRSDKHRGRIECLPGRAHLLVTEDDAAVADTLDQHRVVAHQHYAAAAFAGQLHQQRQGPALGDGVEARGRLVGEQKARLQQQHPQDGEALQLAAGDLAGAALQQMLVEPKARHQRGDGAAIQAVAAHQVVEQA